MSKIVKVHELFIKGRKSILFIKSSLCEIEWNKRIVCIVTRR